MYTVENGITKKVDNIRDPRGEFESGLKIDNSVIIKEDGPKVNKYNPSFSFDDVEQKEEDNG